MTKHDNKISAVAERSDHLEDPKESRKPKEETKIKKPKPLHECDDLDKSRTEKPRNKETSKKKRKGCCMCMGCFPCCSGEGEE